MLSPKHIQKIVSAYKERNDTEKYSHVASYDEIKENDFNLNIPRYVDTFEDERPVDLVKVSDEIVKIDDELSEKQSDLLAMMNELVVNKDSQLIIESTKRILAGGNHE